MSLCCKGTVCLKISFSGVSDTDAEDDRLLVKDTRGGTNVIGWNEIAVVFGAKQNEKEDFRSIKVMHTTLDKYDPRSYLPASVKTNPNKKLVSGQPYHEILYYKDVAPYGPTYHLMTTVAELFWSAGRSNKFLTPMILAYLRGLHGHSYNWAKAILHGLSDQNSLLKSRACSNEEMQAAGGDTHCVLGTARVDKKAPCRRQATGGDSHCVPGIARVFKKARAEDAECGLPSTKKNKPMCVQQNEGQNSGVRTRFTQPSRPNIPTEIIMPQPVQSSGECSESTLTPSGAILVEDLNGTSNEDSPTKPPNVINFHLLPYVQARIQRHSAAIETWKKAYEDQLSKVRELQETNDGLRGQVAAKYAEKSTVHALARTEVQRELEELKKSVTELEDFKRPVPAKEKAAEETHVQKLALVQTQLEEYKRSSEASIKRLEEEASHLREALVEKESAVQALENAHQKEISTLKATCQKYKTLLDGEIGTNADLQARVLNLQDELSTCKYTQEQALQGQKSARAELLEIKKQLHMLQVLHQDVDEGNAASAP
ncbi:hypothetical protein R1flu_001477 [Riccia fluitans]|uniref:Protein FAM184A/B N-terminal domain-containing protein n=1 Tax=Riccia fluitans TaxID=41844 RepID=A0ABD1Y6P8_9MARC